MHIFTAMTLISTIVIVGGSVWIWDLRFQLPVSVSQISKSYYLPRIICWQNHIKLIRTFGELPQQIKWFLPADLFLWFLPKIRLELGKKRNKTIAYIRLWAFRHHSIIIRTTKEFSRIVSTPLTSGMNSVNSGWVRSEYSWVKDRVKRVAFSGLLILKTLFT
jgi:hypothetical protein